MTGDSRNACALTGAHAWPRLLLRTSAGARRRLEPRLVQRRAQAVVAWLQGSELDPLLSEFTVPRLGILGRVLTTELQHRAVLHHGTFEQRMQVVIQVLLRLLAAGKLRRLGELLKPVPHPEAGG